MLLATRAVQWFKGLVNRLIEREVSQIFPEIDTSFLGDAGPLPIAVGPHWSQYVGKVILVREIYYSKEVVKKHIGPVILMSVDSRKGTLCLQRVLKREGVSVGLGPKKVGPPYHIACRDCQFITDLSHPFN
jgi:hypothetical protein